MAKKSLGQNFLMHPQIAGRIVQAAKLQKRATVLEIGPGTGMLTRALLAEGHQVIAVEADGELVERLMEAFAEEIASKRLTLVHEDIRAFAIDSLPEGYALVANIPYYITGEIIRTFLSARHKPVSMTLLVQKEVAERITRAKKESLLSLSVKAYGSPAYCFTVPKGAFRPAPKVDSAVISIQDVRQDAFESGETESFFFDLLKAGFAHKRKFLAGNLEALFPKSVIENALKKAEIGPKSRPEDLTLADWKRLATLLSKKRAL